MRLQIESAKLEIGRPYVARVTLLAPGDNRVTGTAFTLTSDKPAVRQAYARATLDALNATVPDGCFFSLNHLGNATLGSWRVTMAVVRLSRRGQAEEQLIGAVSLKDNSDLAPVKAVLDATNRRWEKISVLAGVMTEQAAK
jgi:hypothetical protein